MTGQPIVAIHRETGQIIHINQVKETGLKCGCICHDCEEPLQAVLNTPYRPHFRHSHNLNCNPTPESRLHLLAKAIIAQNNRIMIPGRGTVAYTDPKVEARCGDLVPDATITANGRPVYIEVVVTHPLHPPKVAQYRENKATVLVIRLSEEDRDIDDDTLRYLVLQEPDCRYLLPYPAGEEKISPKPDLPWWAALIGLGGAAFLWLKYRNPKNKPSRSKRRR